jgi:hypothetical protein
MNEKEPRDVFRQDGSGDIGAKGTPPPAGIYRFNASRIYGVTVKEMAISLRRSHVVERYP